MNTLVLIPNLKNLRYAYISSEDRSDNKSYTNTTYKAFESDIGNISKILNKIHIRKMFKNPDFTIDAIAIRSKFGGHVFSGPAIVDAKIIEELNRLKHSAPLNIPSVLLLIEACGEVFPDVPIILVFETSFFVNLPEREKFYGLDIGLSKSLGIIRYGFNGIYHEAACKSIIRKRREKGLDVNAKILSVCLEPKPEIAAIVGITPKMVTSGVTPLEGLPGYKTCGELDPTIVLTLSQKLGWGPEQINTMLTSESGFYGLCGKETTLEEIFKKNSEEYTFVREFIQYRILLACGAGIAAMGGLDAIIFSGRYAHIGEYLGKFLKSKISFPKEKERDLILEIFDEGVEQIIADEAVGILLSKSAEKLELISNF